LDELACDSGPWGPGFKSRAPDQCHVARHRSQFFTKSAGTRAPITCTRLRKAWAAAEFENDPADQDSSRPATRTLSKIGILSTGWKS